MGFVKYYIALFFHALKLRNVVLLILVSMIRVVVSEPANLLQQGGFWSLLERAMRLGIASSAIVETTQRPIRTA